MIDAKTEFYDSILRDLSGGTIQTLGSSRAMQQAEKPSKIEIVNGVELMGKKFDDPKYLWDAVLPDAGLAVMAASKASGKTMILLQLADAISKGRPFLGLATAVTKTLFLELELSERRTQQRLLKIGIVPDGNLDFAFRWEQGQEGLNAIADVVKECGYGLVVVDVMQLLWPLEADSNSYQDVYAVLSPLRQLANDLGVMIVLVTHRRKAETADYVDGVIGSVGIQANADVILSLLRTRGENEALLYVDGNDVESRKIALRFNVDPLGFSLSEASVDEIRLTPERRAIMETMRELGGTAGTHDIALALGKDDDNVSHLLKKLSLAGLIKSTSYGIWTIKNSVQSVQSDQTDIVSVQSIQTVQSNTTSVQSDQSIQSNSGTLNTLNGTLNTGDQTANTTKKQADWPATTPLDDGSLFDTNEVFDDDVSNETLAIAARVFSELIETNKEGLCVANWRLSCMAEGVSTEAFDEAKKKYDKLGVYTQNGGVVRLKV